jgi:putative transposase
MRCARIKADGAGYYHVMSRAIERRFIFDRRGKEKFHEIMRKLEAFCGVRIITYTILDSHWHILLEVPVRREITDEELIRRIEILYDTPTARMIHLQLHELREKAAEGRVYLPHVRSLGVLQDPETAVQYVLQQEA